MKISLPNNRPMTSKEKNDQYSRLIKTFKTSIDRRIEKIAKKYHLEPFQKKELKQNVAVKIWMNIEKVAKSDSIKSYIYTIVKHACLDIINLVKKDTERRKKDIKKFTSELNPKQQVLISEDFDNPNKEEDSMLVLKSILSSVLDEETCDLILQVKIHKKRYKDISQKYKKSEGALRKQVSIGLEKVRNFVKNNQLNL